MSSRNLLGIVVFLCCLGLLLVREAHGLLPKSQRSHNLIRKQVNHRLFLENEQSSRGRTGERVIHITEKAIDHICNNMRGKQDADDTVVLRMSVLEGGCSGMSYDMNVIKCEEILENDHVEIYNGVHCVVDPKSLSYLFGLRLDYSDETLHGGFQFTNPNAQSECGCGKSFGVLKSSR